MSRVLVLTCGIEPHKIVSFEHAITMLYNDPPKAEVMATTEEVIYRKEELVVKMPSVIRLVKPIVGMKRAVKFSRMNVFTRDGFRCMYCGSPKKMKELNYDHVIPRHLGGKTVWENVVASCYSCNTKKANRTPEQAAMRLIKKPVKPSWLPIQVPRFDPRDIPSEWADWLRGYLLEEAVA